jgi:Family of unknown function (DUF6166)
VTEAYDEYRIYHGIYDAEGTRGEESPFWIDVEHSGGGRVYRSFNANPYHSGEYGKGHRTWSPRDPIRYPGKGSGAGPDISWGHNGGGGGNSAAAELILGDAIGEQPSFDLREAFCEDILMQLCDDWRLGRGAVLRWARGWYTEHGEDALMPAAVAAPPGLIIDES